MHVKIVGAKMGKRWGILRIKVMNWWEYLGFELVLRVGIEGFV